MDLLTDILTQAGLKMRILTQNTYLEPISLNFPCSKSIGFHLVLSGEASLFFEDEEKPILLKKGDIALIARGHDHVIKTYKKKDNTTKLTLISGAYQFWNTPIHPFFKDIPDCNVIQSEDSENFDQLNITINMLIKEFSKRNVGSESIVHNLLDIIFVLILRNIIEQKSNKPESWSKAVNDLQIKKAIELFHEDYKRNWSLDEVAQKVGLSRAGFALKFKKSMGDTPLHYLNSIRIQKSMIELINTDEKIESISNSVGFNDPFTYSKVFKRITGISPREFRLKDRSEKSMKNRF